MTETWRLAGDPERSVTGVTGPVYLESRLRIGRLETVFRSDRGRSLHVITNGERALVMLLEEVGDPGQHAVDATATGSSGGYVLTNGQVDEYDNRDTVRWPLALDLVGQVLGARTLSGSDWQTDR